jgi:CitMHS family citrate-Mg2+:H+ or citrate-Ca2+:H+ symporter
MLTWLGVLTIAALLVLILGRITSVLVALTLVPVAAGLAGGFGLQIGAFAMDGIRSVLPVAALLAFAVTYFGVMNDAGLFEPLIRGVVGLVGRDPVRIVLGTSVIAAATHLDGAGASTFMVTVPAMLPIYQRVGMRPVTLTCAAALAAGTMNMLPWAGPAARAAAALHVSATDIFVPAIPAMIAGLAGVFLCAVHLGRRERARLAGVAPGTAPHRDGVWGASDHLPRPEAVAAGRAGRVRYALNAALTIAALAALFTDLLPPAIVFVIALALALLINHPDPREQRERLTAHGTAAMLMVTTIFAAGVFTGILSKSGMLASMASDLAGALPQAVLRHLPVAMGAVAMPLSLTFDPDSFYFGLLPVLASASQAAGGSAIEVGRAAILGQMTTGFPVSPLTPATFLLVGLAGADLADHQRRTIPYAFGVTLVMTLVAWLTGGIRG